MIYTTNLNLAKYEANDTVTFLGTENSNIQKIDDGFGTLTDDVSTALTDSSTALTTSGTAETYATQALNAVNSKPDIDNTSTSDTNTYSSRYIKELLDDKADGPTGAITTVYDNNLYSNRVVTTNSSGKLVNSDISTTKLGYLSNVTSDIQTQLNSKSNTSWTHATQITLTTNRQEYINSYLSNASEILLVVEIDGLIGHIMTIPYHLATSQNNHNFALSDNRGLWNAINIGLDGNNTISYYKDSNATVSVLIDIYYRI